MLQAGPHQGDTTTLQLPTASTAIVFTHWGSGTSCPRGMALRGQTKIHVTKEPVRAHSPQHPSHCAGKGSCLQPPRSPASPEQDISVLTVLNWSEVAPLASVIQGVTSPGVLSLLCCSTRLPGAQDGLCDVNQPAAGWIFLELGEIGTSEAPEQGESQKYHETGPAGCGEEGRMLISHTLPHG